MKNLFLILSFIVAISCDPILKVTCPTDTWEQRFALLDTFHKSIKPYIPDSTWNSNYLVMMYHPKGGSQSGFFVDTNKVLYPIDSAGLATLGIKTIYLKFSDPVPSPVSINSGGETDKYFTGGISVDYDSSYYGSERYGDFSYDIPIGNGLFNVELHFVEVFWHESGKRVFDVVMEKDTIIENIDLYFGFDNDPYVYSTQVFVMDGYLNIDLITIIDNAKISGIEIEKIE